MKKSQEPEASGHIVSLSPFYPAWAPSPWDGAAYLQGGPSLLSKASLETPSQTHAKFSLTAILKSITWTVTVAKKLPSVHFQSCLPSVSWHFEADSHTEGLGFSGTLGQSCSNINTWSIWEAGNTGADYILRIFCHAYSSKPCLFSPTQLCALEAIHSDFLFLPTATLARD